MRFSGLVLAGLAVILVSSVSLIRASAAGDAMPVAPSIPFLGCSGWSDVGYSGEQHDYPKGTSFPDRGVGDGLPHRSLMCHALCSATVVHGVLTDSAGRPAVLRVQKPETVINLDQWDPYVGTNFTAPFYVIAVTCLDPGKTMTRGPGTPTGAPVVYPAQPAQDARRISEAPTSTVKFGPSHSVVADVTTGLFDTDFGLLSMGPYNGTYSHNNGKVTVAGRSGDAAVDGDWEEFPGTRRCSDGRYRGHFHFEFSQAGFVGSYGYCDAPANAGRWNGTRRGN